MKNWMLFLFAFLALSPFASAQNEPAADEFDIVEVISYDELMALTPEKREGYLEAVRDLLNELSEMTENDGPEMVAQNSIKKEAALELIQTLSEEAQAKTPMINPSRPTTPLTAGYLARPRYTETMLGLQWSCDAARFGVIFNYDVGTCAKPKPAGKSCERRFVEAKIIKDNSSRNFCIPEESWNRVDFARQRELRAGAPSVREDVKKTGGARFAIGGTSCALSLRECNARAFEMVGGNKSWRTQIPNNRQCVFAGNISSYSSPTKAKGTCKSVNEFKYSASAPPLRCGSSEAICNPLVFGVRDGGDGKPTPFCVPARGAATKTCGEISRRGPRMADFLNQGIVGIRDRWNEFAAGFSNLCGRNAGTARGFFCQECNVMMQRLNAARALYMDQQCNKIKSWDQLKQGAARTNRRAR